MNNKNRSLLVGLGGLFSAGIFVQFLDYETLPKAIAAVACSLCVSTIIFFATRKNAIKNT